MINYNILSPFFDLVDNLLLQMRGEKTARATILPTVTTAWVGGAPTPYLITRNVGAEVRGLQQGCKWAFLRGDAKIKWPKSEEFFVSDLSTPRLPLRTHVEDVRTVHA